MLLEDVGGSGGGQNERELDITGGVGTGIYMSPEAIANDDAMLRAHPFASDVFSFGVLAWQILAGERPYVNRYPP